MKKKAETWPKVWKLSKDVYARLSENGNLTIEGTNVDVVSARLFRAEVRKLFVRLKGLYLD